MTNYHLAAESVKQKQDDWEAARDEALQQAIDNALAKPITEDDVYETACSLEMGSKSDDRELLAELHRRVEANPNDAEALTQLGFHTHRLINVNRALRAEQDFWKAQ